MTYKVLVVEDSSFFQQRLKQIINEHPDLEVCGIADNGHRAIEMAVALKPDVISMDYEMPFMDGVTAIKAIMAESPVPIVMFSSLTYEGARITLDAMEAGAVDFIPKNFAEVSRNSEKLKTKLQNTLLSFVKGPSVKLRPLRLDVTFAPPPKIREPKTEKISPPSPPPMAKKLFNIKVIIIGCSTGGPVALTEVLQHLPKNFAVPVVVVQHMPSKFTKALADRLDRHCRLRVAEARSGDILKSGHVYIAPGGQQLLFNSRGGLRVLPGDDRVNYKPSVDITFASASNVYGGSVLGLVLTGMGSDGCEGARLLKQKGAVIWSQDEASCVVYGMPRAVEHARLVDDVVPLKDMGARILQGC